METLVQRLEQAVIRLEQVSVNMQVSNGMANGECNGINGGQSQCMEAFDLLLMGPLSEYLKNSRAIGEDVEKHAEMVNNALQLQRSFLKMATTHQEPAQMELSDLLKPISEKIQEIQNFRERNRGSSQFNHLSAVSESIPALGWVAVSQKPVPYVKEMNDAAIFYTNRVLKDYKDSDKRHVEWVRSYLSIWTELQAFIKQHHTTGLVWSKTGPIAPPSLFAPAPGGPCPPPPPPPPPPGPPPVFTGEPPQADSTTAQQSALFAQLNQGEAITKALKHVSKDQMTHKNPALRSQGGEHHSSPPKSRNPGGSSNRAPPQKRPPLLELEGKKWRVEYFDQAHDLVIEETELRQVAYVFGCSNSTLQIKGKINSIIVDNCKKLGLVFDNVVGIVEVINSKDIQLQVMGRVPTISINKTEGCQVYLSKDALDCEIVSAKSSEMNILVPQDDEYREFPVPEQFKTVWDGSKLVTEPTEIAG
ncbi:adenylyl cyclase-associated protein 2 isoform X2 [Coregonus clupeaformis]|uniref:adenylyl cyclase-associated protein 2 isoform X2 n=1 Tax=Coregonus clupeaformis TaxID=59861 RepID=UPI001E1C9B1E|nr:adenylyl cyclase-associated protein 2 isoform X2 [Coregonus clupeaformis]